MIPPSGITEEAKVPRRDWIIMPLLGLLTIVLLLGSTEWMARRTFSGSKTLIADCMVLNDPSTGPRAIPNCVSWEKAPESPPIEYRFNRCGHRSSLDCESKQPGAYRIVLVGSSVALGELVQRDQSFAALLPSDLSQETGRNVELYNEGMGWGFPHSMSMRFNDALSARPDMILWVLGAGDIEAASLVLQVNKNDPDPNRRSLNLLQKARFRIHEAFHSEPGANVLSEVFGHTRTAVMLRYFLFKSQSRYVASYLMGADGVAGFLKADLSADWRRDLSQFDVDAANMIGRAKSAGVPLVAVYLPSGAQAAMISMGQWPQGYDPFEMDNEIRSIIVRHGGTYISILPDYRNLPNPERGYYLVDSHPNPDGHAAIARMVARELTCGAVPELKVNGRRNDETRLQK
jgi:hypothetical protein